MFIVLYYSYSLVIKYVGSVTVIGAEKESARQVHISTTFLVFTFANTRGKARILFFCSVHIKFSTLGWQLVYQQDIYEFKTGKKASRHYSRSHDNL